MKPILVFLLSLIFCAPFAAIAADTVLINDAFSGAKNGSIEFRTPDKANAPGGKWSVMGFSMGGGFQALLDVDSASATPCAYLVCGGNSMGAIAIPLFGPGFLLPSRLSISAELRGANPSLGFYSKLSEQDDFDGADAFLNFTGLSLGSNGSLSLYRQGGLVSTIPYTGTFDPKEFHKLSYYVDVTSGMIFDVRLQGSTSDYSSFGVSGLITDDAIHYAALAALCDGGRDNQAYARNFIVTTLPTDSTSAQTPALKKTADTSSPIILKSGDRLGYMGDSITALGNSRKGYVQLVIAGLKAEDVDVTPVPAGHSGDTSGNMAARTNIDVLHKGANWMTLSCGVNDVMLQSGGHGVDLESYKKNVETMYKKTQAWNVRMVILTATPLGEDAGNANNQKLATYNDFLRSFAAEHKLPLADMNAAFWKVLNTPDTSGVPAGKRLLADGIHPNDAGQFLMATTLLRALSVPEADMPKVEQVLKDYAAGK